MIKNHILHCDGSHCPLKLHLIMPGQEATRVGSLIFCAACKPVEQIDNKAPHIYHPSVLKKMFGKYSEPNPNDKYDISADFANGEDFSCGLSK